MSTPETVGMSSSAELIRELEETATWLYERAEVLEKLFEPLAARHRGKLRIEITKMRGRALLLRHIVARAKG